jgi:hypothetical protein
MKNTIASVILLVTGVTSRAQPSNYIYKIEPLHKKQSFYLTAGASSVFGSGKSREAVQIDLPPNTVEWYYSVTTSPDKTQAVDNNLTAQLAKYLVPESGIKPYAALSLVAPNGTAACDFSVFFSPVEVNKFLAEQPAVGMILKDSRKNFVSGVVQVRDFIFGTCYLTMRNPSAVQGINITVEVVAIVKEAPDQTATAASATHQ